ncbi:TPA: hypothetical protein PBF49_001596 [Staphylococcus aureus]|nr:hypothetical protein [Staphylococcus aureus]HEI6472506.1 hypothetical protein [Staphylococcus aureus]HEI6614436.1 hypothetical protein [Staphylococcus aureus]
MAKESLMNKVESSLDNSFINKEQKFSSVPRTSIRVKGVTHSKINVLKKVEMIDSIDELLDETLNLYISKFPKDKQNKIEKMIMEENEFKIKKARKTSK